MRLLNLSMIRSGTVLFALDAVLVALTWPLVLWVGRPDWTMLFSVPADMRGYAYPVLDLLLLFAMGMYRREALTETGKSLARCPWSSGWARC